MRPTDWLDRRTVTPAERRWVLVFAGLVLFLTSLPYLIGYAVQGDGYRFTGFVFGVEDGNSYIAKMITGAFGDWLFRTPYSGSFQAGVWLFPIYIWLGKLAAPPGLHEQMVALFHLFRVLAGLLYMLASYDFLAFFLGEVRWRRFGVALVSLGGGLGWLLVLLGQTNWLGSLPLDVHSPETFGFLHLYGLPHLALARAGMLWTLLAYLKLILGLSRGTPAVVRLGFFWLLTGLGQPLTMAITGLLIGVHLVCLAAAGWFSQRQGAAFDWKTWGRQAIAVGAAGLLPGVMLAYTIWISWADPYIKGWTAQNLILSPHPLHYLLAYGLVLPYAGVGLLHRLRGRGRLAAAPADRAFWLPTAWVLLAPFLAYAPLVLQRRLTEGVWVAWVILALVALDRPQMLAACRFSWRASLPLLLAFLTALFLLLGGITAAGNPTPPLFRPEQEVRLFEFLQQEVIQGRAQPGEVVLASFDTANPLPAWAPLRVMVGHGPESVGFDQLQEQVQAFFSSTTTDQQRSEFIRLNHIRYVIWGPAERQLGDWSPEAASFLSLRSQSQDYFLFEVMRTP